MKMVAISRMKDSFMMLPPERQAVIMEATFAWVDKYRRAGKLKRMYHAPGWDHRTMTILDVDSPEEANRIALENPSYNYMEMESHNLMEWDSFLKMYRETYAELAVRR